ncbi:MAG: Gfo/Idh/MocA family oxidoreductase [Thaumarchaeota archaeon]|nr:MAG: Gfo/Idh/MocA family oxidoreductase [Nitrososphaerota archaeon]
MICLIPIMKFGIIGFGRMGKMYYDIISKMEIELSFICDIIKPMNDLKYFQNYKEALDNLTVDGLIISTTAPSHNEIIQYAIEKKIRYIVCEKPFTTSVIHADEIITKLKNSDTRLAVNYLRRYSSIYAELKRDLYESNIIGKPRNMIITCGAGGLSTVGTHFFDLCTYLLESKVKFVYAIAVNKNLPNPRGKEFEDPGGHILLNFENESRAYIDMGDDLGLQHSIEIIGEYGRVIIDESNENITIRSRSTEDRMKPMHLYGLPNPVIRNESFKLETIGELITKMIRNLTSESDIIVTPNIAREKVEIYSAIRNSFDTKKPIHLPLNDEYYKREFIVT